MVVEGERRLVGAFTDGDLRRALQRRGPALLDAAVRDVMTAQPRTCTSAIRAFEAMQVCRTRVWARGRRCSWPGVLQGEER